MKIEFQHFILDQILVGFTHTENLLLGAILNRSKSPVDATSISPVHRRDLKLLFLDPTNSALSYLLNRKPKHRISINRSDDRYWEVSANRFREKKNWNISIRSAVKLQSYWFSQMSFGFDHCVDARQMKIELQWLVTCRLCANHLNDKQSQMCRIKFALMMLMHSKNSIEMFAVAPVLWKSSAKRVNRMTHKTGQPGCVA